MRSAGTRQHNDELPGPSLYTVYSGAPDPFHLLLEPSSACCNAPSDIHVPAGKMSPETPAQPLSERVGQHCSLGLPAPPPPVGTPSEGSPSPQAPAFPFTRALVPESEAGLPRQAGCVAPALSLPVSTRGLGCWEARLEALPGCAPRGQRVPALSC